nr:SH3 domain-containing protein [Acidobacteriota bacterium]
PKRRYGTVSEFWHELAQVAVLAPSVRAEDIPNEETIVKPRLSLHRSMLPQTPVMPDFDPTPATSQLQETVAPAMPVEAELARQGIGTGVENQEVVVGGKTRLLVDVPPARRDDRPGKIFIDLQPQKAAPIAPAPVPQPLQQGKPQPPADRRPMAKPPIKVLPAPVASKFSEKVRRRAFIGFLAVAFVGLLLAVYNNFQAGTFGTPREIEVVAEQMNVRERPGSKSLGVVAKGTRHHVIAQNGQGWLQIEVSQWMVMTPGVSTDIKQGWVNGSADFVKVVSRRWW